MRLFCSAMLILSFWNVAEARSTESICSSRGDTHLRDFPQKKLTLIGNRLTGKFHQQAKVLFKRNYHQLNHMGIQLGIQKFSKSRFAASGLKHLDRRHLSKHLGPEDFITVSKTLYVLKNSQPKDHNVHLYTSPKYLNAAYYDTKWKVLNSHSIETKTNYVVTEVTSKVEFAYYNFETGKHQHLSAHKAAKAIPKHVKYQPQAISFADGVSVSDGSHGTSATYLYYQVGKHTLVEAYKLVSFKKEGWYSGWKYKSWLWPRIQKDSISNQVLSGEKITNNIRKQVFPK